MRSTTWEYLLGGLFLVACLLGGLSLGREVAPKPVIGVLRFAGVIDFNTAEYLIEVLDAARQDENVAGVVMEILSPGGFATSSESIYYSMLQVRESKPLVVYIDGLAASGGYYMAVASNRIYVPPSARVGNIGARTIQPNDPSLAPQELSSGPFKLSGGSRFDFIRQLDLVANAFISSVVHQRTNATDNPLTISEEEVAEARIYLGSQAVGVGLADHEGGRSDAILGVAELAGLEQYDVVDLGDYLEIANPTEQLVQMDDALAAMVAEALPDTVYLLDSRIPLDSYVTRSMIDEHLLSLRNVDINPASRSRSTTEQAPDFLGEIVPSTN